MATSIQYVANSATPHSLKLKASGDNAPGVFSLNAFASALVEGPLKKMLFSVAPAALNAFNVDAPKGNKIRIYDCPVDSAAPRALATTIAWTANNDPALAGLTCTLAATNVRVLEIRFNHSTQA